VSKFLVEASICTIGGGEENIGVDYKGAGECGGVMWRVLVDASTNLVLCLNSSKKIYKTHKEGNENFVQHKGIRNCTGV
jgi:hypothetical protein